MIKCKYIPKYKDIKKKDTLAAECEAAWMRIQTAKSEAMTEQETGGLPTVGRKSVLGPEEGVEVPQGFVCE